MHGGERGDLPGLDLRFFGEAERANDGVEGVADVAELGMQLLIVPVKKLLQALEQVRREVRSVAGGIAMRADGVDPCDHEGPVTCGRTEQTAMVEPVGGPAECMQEPATLAVEHRRGLAGVEVAPDMSEQPLDNELGALSGSTSLTTLSQSKGLSKRLGEEWFVRAEARLIRRQIWSVTLLVIRAVHRGISSGVARGLC